jgi:hypothetical protein
LDTGPFGICGGSGGAEDSSGADGAGGGATAGRVDSGSDGWGAVACGAAWHESARATALVVSRVRMSGLIGSSDCLVAKERRLEA